MRVHFRFGFFSSVLLSKKRKKNGGWRGLQSGMVFALPCKGVGGWAECGTHKRAGKKKAVLFLFQPFFLQCGRICCGFSEFSINLMRPTSALPQTLSIFRDCPSVVGSYQGAGAENEGATKRGQTRLFPQG
jgi:hypothetical protein